MKVIYTFGDDISTDTIYPGRFMATVLPSETPQYAFADLDFNKDLVDKKYPPNSILVGGNNFGCGSSREQAASCLKGFDLIIVAKSFARIFLQNSINLGLQTIAAPNIVASVGDELEIQHNVILNKTAGQQFDIVPLSPAQLKIVDAGGLIPFTRKRLMEEK
jgi:3-isopropylmalate/(R)-2-methylmalate dehydratase small subunit